MLKIAVVIAAVLLPAGLWAQGIRSELDTVAKPYGSGQEARLSFPGETSPTNVVLWGVGAETGYDDNVFSASGAARTGDTLYDLGPHISILHQGERLSAGIDYQPYFQLYEHATQYDRVNQALAADLSYTVTPHLSLRFRDAFTYQTNTFQPQLGTTFVSGLGSPSSLNTTIYAPLVPERGNGLRVDAMYEKSARTAVSFFGAYDERNFIGQPAHGKQLLNTRGATAGSGYNYRLSEHATLGILYVFERLNSEGVLPAGSASGTVIHSVLASVGWRLTPTVSFEAFSGPQYVLPRGVAGLTPPLHSLSNQVDWAAGGTGTKVAGKFAILASAQRIVTDGGGFLAYVRSSSVDAGLRRQFGNRWDLTLDLGVGRNQATGLGLRSDNIDSQNATLSLEHALSESLTTRLSYSFIHQVSTGALPFGADFNRDRITFGVFYRLRTIPLGR